MCARQYTLLLKKGIDERQNLNSKHTVDSFITDIIDNASTKVIEESAIWYSARICLIIRERGIFFKRVQNTLLSLLLKSSMTDS